ncbi:MAG: hypothetical protein GXY41_04165 [Phycisphaerae bacterium]|nr:hypothetical protein [Phycisphaerae bacterium]
MITEILHDILNQQAAPVVTLAAKADKIIDDLQTQLASAHGEIERFKSARCAQCGASLPVDGKCVACRVKKMPKSAQEAFRAGAVALAQAVAMCRKAGRFVDSGAAFRLLIDAVADSRDNLDRREAAQAAADKLASTGGFLNANQGIVNFSEELFSE